MAGAVQWHPTAPAAKKARANGLKSCIDEFDRNARLTRSTDTSSDVRPGCWEREHAPAALATRATSWRRDACTGLAALQRAVELDGAARRTPEN